MCYSNFFFLFVFLAVLEDHCHRERNEEIDKKARKKLLIASTLCVIFMIAEIVGNILCNRHKRIKNAYDNKMCSKRCMT